MAWHCYQQLRSAYTAASAVDGRRIAGSPDRRIAGSPDRRGSEHIRLYLAPALGHYKLTELSETDIESLYAAMRQLWTTRDGKPSDTLVRLEAARGKTSPTRVLSAATIRRVHATLLSALNSAVRRKYIPANPARNVEIPSGRRPRAVVWTPDRILSWQGGTKRPAVAVWTAEQAGRFLDRAAKDRLYPLFHLVAYRALRRGEAVGLRWEDVDLGTGSIRITQQIVQLGWKTEVGDPKTQHGERTISIDEATVRVLRRWRDIQQRERTTWGPDADTTGLVFTREDGTGLHPDLATDGFQRLSRLAGLPPIRLHDLRHTAASLALQAGVPMKVVSEQLGHSSLAITADWGHLPLAGDYTSVLPAVAKAAAEAVAGVIPRTPPGGDRAAALTFRYQSSPEGAFMSDPRDPTSEKLQVRGVGPAGIEPATHGLKAWSSPCKPVHMRTGHDRPGWSEAISCVGGCQPISRGGDASVHNPATPRRSPTRVGGYARKWSARLPRRRPTIRHRPGMGHRRAHLRHRLPPLLRPPALWADLRAAHARPRDPCSAAPQEEHRHRRPCPEGTRRARRRHHRTPPLGQAAALQPLPPHHRQPGRHGGQAGWPQDCGHRNPERAGRP
jgi:integrase